MQRNWKIISLGRIYVGCKIIRWELRKVATFDFHLNYNNQFFFSTGMNRAVGFHCIERTHRQYFHAWLAWFLNALQFHKIHYILGIWWHTYVCMNIQTSKFAKFPYGILISYFVLRGTIRKNRLYAILHN